MGLFDFLKGKSKVEEVAEKPKGETEAPQYDAGVPLGRKTCNKCGQISFDTVAACPGCGTMGWWLENPLRKEIPINPSGESPSTATKVKESLPCTPVSMCEARAQAVKLNMIRSDSGAVVAALHLEQRPKSSSIYVHGRITCVCTKSLPLTVSMSPGIFGGAPGVSCPDCGTRIGIMEEMSGTTAVVAASVEAVKRQYQSHSISLILTGVSNRREEMPSRASIPSNGTTSDICSWCSASDLRDANALQQAFMKTQFTRAKPDWTGLERMASRLPNGWMRHVIWLNMGCECKGFRSPRWAEAARCFTLSLSECYQYEDWSHSLSASWQIVEIADTITDSLSPEKASALKEQLRKRGSLGADPGAEVNRTTVSMLRETFTDWPAYLDGRLLNAKGVESLSALPGKSEMRAMFLATLLAVPQSFLRLLQAATQNFAYLLSAREVALKESETRPPDGESPTKLFTEESATPKVAPSSLSAGDLIDYLVKHRSDPSVDVDSLVSVLTLKLMDGFYSTPELIAKALLKFGDEGMAERFAQIRSTMKPSDLHMLIPDVVHSYLSLFR